MGNQPTSNASPQNSESVPYTSFSLPKNENDVKQQDEIMIIKRKEEIKEKDEILNELHKLPQFEPLIKPQEESIFNVLSTNPKIDKLGLTLFSLYKHFFVDFIDSKSLIDIAAHFQSKTMKQIHQIGIREELLIQKMQQCSIAHTRTLNDFNKSLDQLRKVNTNLRDGIILFYPYNILVDRLSRNIQDATRQVNAILKQLHELNNLIPNQVKQQIENPLIK